MKKLIAVLALTLIPLQLVAQDAFLIIPFSGDFNQPADVLNEPGVSLPATTAGNPVYIRVAPGRYAVGHPAEITALRDHDTNQPRTAIIQGAAGSSRGVSVEILDQHGIFAGSSPVSEAARVYTERDDEQEAMEAAVKQAIADDPRVRDNRLQADGAILQGRPDDHKSTIIIVTNREVKSYIDQSADCYESADLTMNITDTACLQPGQSVW